MDRNIKEKIDNINQASTSYLLFLYRKYRLQIVNFSSHIAFIRQCIRENLHPRFLKYRFYSDNHHITRKLHTLIQKKLLQYEMYRWYGRKNTNSRLLALIQLKLASRFRDFELNRILHETDRICNSQHHTLKTKKDKKLAVLRGKAHKPDEASHQMPAFYPRCVNLTDVIFDKDESKLLEKGLKFALPPSNKTQVMDNLVADLMVGLSGNSATGSQCAEIMKSELHNQLSIPPPPTSVIKSMKRKMKSRVLRKRTKGTP